MNYLVIANQTLGGDALRTKLRDISGGNVHVHLVVPATPADTDSGVEFSPNDEMSAAEAGRKKAQQRLRQGLAMLSEQNIDANGEVGHPDPMEAVEDAMASGDYDEIIVSTLPGGVSRWIKMDLPSRVSRKYEVPVSHVEANV